MGAILYTFICGIRKVLTSSSYMATPFLDWRCPKKW